jgi:hypothetical protein
MIVRSTSKAGSTTPVGPTLLSWTGNAYGPGSTTNPAPYLRAAYEWNWNGQSAHVGGIFLHSNINPATAPFSRPARWGTTATPTMRSTAATNIIGDGTNVVSLLGIVDHETQNLVGFLQRGGARASRTTR